MTQFLCMVGDTGPISFLCIWLSRCPCIICWKDNFFITELSCHPSKISWLQIGRFIPGLSIPFHCSNVDLYCNTTQSWLLSLCTKFWNQEVLVFQFHSFSRSFWILWVSWISYEFKDQLAISCKASWDFDRDCAESVGHFGEYGHFNNMKSDPWLWMSFHLFRSLISFNNVL